MCSLLAAGVHTAFLICVAQQQPDFDRLPGGELFPANDGESHELDFADLISRHSHEWRHLVGKRTPEPISVPRMINTVAVAADVPIRAYPGHSARAVRVEVTDATAIPLVDGWPNGMTPPA